MNIWTNLLKRNSSLIITGDAEDLLNADHHLDRTFLQAIYNLKQLGHRVIIVSPDVQHAKRTAKFVRRASAAIAKSQARGGVNYLTRIIQARLRLVRPKACLNCLHLLRRPRILHLRLQHRSIANHNILP